jgi:3-oxoacyl-[acyl-carrier protein] reductase
MDLGLADATVVVQGGTKGMGRAAAECFASDGAKVAVLARTQSDIDETVSHLGSLGSPDAVGYRADIRVPEDLTSAFDAIGERWGSLNILVNVAGPDVVGTFEELSDDQWMAALDMGAMGMIRCVRAALPLLRSAEWARIVNVSAHSTKRQTASLVAYTAAKAVVTSVTKNLSLALAEDEILVNTVSPGSFATPALKGWAAGVGIDADDPYAIMAGIAEHYGHPSHLPRAGLSEEIGPVIAFVASKRNSYMTGANVNVDGGSDFT